MKQSLRNRCRILLALVAVGGATPLVAAPGDIVKARIAGYKQLGAAFKKVNDELKAGSPDLKLIGQNAEQIKSLSHKQLRWFPKGSGAAAGVTTRAKAQIWSDGAAFQAAQKEFVARGDSLAKAARSGNVALVRTATQDVGRSCQTCHRAYREDR